MRNRFWKGAAAGGNGGSTGGTSDAHVHTSASHAHASGGTHTHTQSNAAGTVNNGGSNFSSNINSVLFTHDHPDGTTGTAAPAPGGTVASSVASADGQPAWQKLHAIQNNTGVASYPKRIIALWLGTVANIPTGWVLCGGTNGAPNVLDKFVKTASTAGEIETTGGAATHTHGNGSGHTHSFASHTHTFTALANPGGQQDAFHNAETQAHRQHGHTVTGSSGADSATSGSTAIGAVANTTNRPAYTDVAYIQLISQPPDVPTINIPVASASYASILGLDVTVSDPDLDNVFAVLEYDQSDGNWAVIGNGTTVASGQPSTLDWDISSTAPGLAYRVRARAIDSDGFSSAYALTDTFIIGLGFVKLHAASNTAFFFAVNNTRSFWAEPQTAKYILAKGYPTELVQHDRRPFFGVQILSELTNAAVNLTGCTVTFGFCHQFAKVPAVVDGACIITDKAHGRAEYRWATGDLAVPGI
ncbi:MAG TPA: hypothetical protein VGS01_11395, partial [Candidatus Limnocylindria bacterium]|nr:hypothetical protein [Candidatus Limnocylindria bacterium]